MTDLFYDDEYDVYLYEVEKLINIINSVPITSSVAERSFSMMKMIKSPTRSRQTNERLNVLCFLSSMREQIEEEFLDEKVYEEVYAKFQV